MKELLENKTKEEEEEDEENYLKYMIRTGNEFKKLFVK